MAVLGLTCPRPLPSQPPKPLRAPAEDVSGRSSNHVGRCPSRALRPSPGRAGRRRRLKADEIEHHALSHCGWARPALGEKLCLGCRIQI